MGRKCVVPNCDSGYDSNKEKVTLFKIPKNRLQAWQQAIPRKDRVLTEKDHVCAKHFNENEILREISNELHTIKLLKPRLADTAIPTKFPNCPKYLSKEIKKRRLLLHKEEHISKKRKCIVDNSESRDEDVKSIGLSYIQFFDGLWNGIAVKLPSKSWGIHYVTDSISQNRAISLSEMILNKDQTVIRKNVIINDQEIQFYVFGKRVDIKNILTFGDIATTEGLENCVVLFDNLEVCNGGIDVDNAPLNFHSVHYTKDENINAWRHKNCIYIAERIALSDYQYKCTFCRKIKQNIRTFKSRCLNSKVVVLKRAYSRNIERNRKSQKRLQIKNLKLRKELTAVKEQMKELDENQILKKIENDKNIHSSQKLLISECIKSCKYNKKTSRRYTSEWLLLCLLLHIRSPTTYKFLRNNEIMPLPAVSTIRGYLSRVKLKCGLDDSFFEAFGEKMREKNQYQCHGILIFDEIHVRQCINLNVKTMKLIGVQDFGENNKATALTTNKLADHGLVFMFSSLAENFAQPVAVFASKGPTSGTCLAQLVLQIIQRLEKCGAIIDGIVCDGASTNRKMWTKFGITGNFQNPVHKILHPMDDSRHLYFFSDAPHIIKCIRNRLFNQTCLHTPEGIIGWQYYEKLLNIDTKLPGNLRVCPKLTERHINPSNLLKMRVKLATQVFSNSVADGLKFYQFKYTHLKDANCTISFTRRMNDLFDAINRRFPAEGLRKNSKDFNVLRDNLNWLDLWEKMVINGTINKNQFLTNTTAEGLRVSLLSTIDLSQYLMDSCGFKYVLTGKLNQDPLEQFFGTIRQAGRANDHPTFGTFLQLYRMLSVYKLLKPPAFGNCTVSETDMRNRSFNFEDFKNIFTANNECRQTHLLKIRTQLDNLLNSEDWEERSEDIESDFFTPETIDCVIYYLAGYISKKMFKLTNCPLCKQHLYHKETAHLIIELSALTNIKSKGALNHPELKMFHFFKQIETILMNHIDSVDVFDKTVEDIFEQNLDFFPFPCEEHKMNILTNSIFFYVTMRINQYYKQQEKMVAKRSTEKKKESKLQST